LVTTIENFPKRNYDSKMKSDSISSRIKFGNGIASTLARYMNKRFGYQFEEVSLEEDMREMIDFRCAKHNRTAQFKCRDNRSDIIFEAMRFYPIPGGFETIDGRDCRTQSQYYCCLSSDKRKVIVAPTKVVKSMAAQEVSSFNFSQEFVSNLVARALKFRNRSVKIHRADSGVESWFKIDEGTDTSVYYKVLVFVPYDSIPIAAKFELYDGEDLLDENTW
jgi:hypothetical protein